MVGQIPWLVRSYPMLSKAVLGTFMMQGYTRGRYEKFGFEARTRTGLT